MHRGLAFATGLGIGTGLMFLFDPVQGKRRRALLRDKCVSASRKTGKVVEGKARHLRNRTQGIISEVQSHFSAKPAGLESNDQPDPTLQGGREQMAMSH